MATLQPLSCDPDITVVLRWCLLAHVLISFETFSFLVGQVIFYRNPDVRGVMLKTLDFT